MNADTLRIYQDLLGALITEREELDVRIREVELILGQGGTPPPAPRRGRPGRPKAKTADAPPAAPGGARRGRKPKGELSLKEAIIRVTQDKALTKDEILNAVQAIGYRFTTDKPINSINQIVYNKANKFKNDDGKFSSSLKPTPSAPSLPLSASGTEVGNGRSDDQDEPHIKTYTPEELEASRTPQDASSGGKGAKRGRKPGRAKKNA